MRHGDMPPLAEQPELRDDAFRNMLPLMPHPTKKVDPVIEKEWRIMIACYFRQTLKCPPKEDGDGTGGIIAKILDTFNLS
jgi:hypothetical protein